MAAEDHPSVQRAGVASGPLTLARPAMATRFEIALHGGRPAALRAAGEEALDEVERLEARLSLYRPGSEISQVNARAAREAVRVSPEVFALLLRARQLSAETGGAFDITIAPLVRAWGFMGGNGKLPAPGEVEKARSVVGMNLVRLDEKNFTVRFEREGVMLDLGAIGKGYAVEAAAEILREAGVTSALLHGGTSTIYALGHPPDAECWTVGIGEIPGAMPGEGVRAAAEKPLKAIHLKDKALSVSGLHGKFFHAGEQDFGHVIDPRNGQAVSNAVQAAVILPSATETDAFSTALLVSGSAGEEKIRRLRPEMKTLLATKTAAGLETSASGFGG